MLNTASKAWIVDEIPTPSNCRLLQLPGELRNKIYAYVVREDGLAHQVVVAQSYGVRDLNRKSSRLLDMPGQIGNECRDVFYEVNSFWFSLLDTRDSGFNLRGLPCIEKGVPRMKFIYIWHREFMIYRVDLGAGLAHYRFDNIGRKQHLEHLNEEIISRARKYLDTIISDDIADCKAPELNPCRLLGLVELVKDAPVTKGGYKES